MSSSSRGPASSAASRSSAASSRPIPLFAEVPTGGRLTLRVGTLPMTPASTASR